MRFYKQNIVLLFSILILSLISCQQPGKNSTGSEYMPDMGHSVAYEANVYGYYSLNRWGTKQEYYNMSAPRKAVKGSIARGFLGGSKEYTGESSVNSKSYAPNGSVPYYYDDTEEERVRASAEIINNPYPITAKGLAKGKELYNIYCGICHGEKGDGAGYLVRDGSKYPAQPANFMLEEFLNASNGRYYHSIMYGKNVMGSYADKLSYVERWDVIHYIRSLQAASKNLAYNEKVNTFTKVDVPEALTVKVKSVTEEKPAESPKSETSKHSEKH